VKVVVNETLEVVSEIYLRDAPGTWKGYVGWTAIALGVGGFVGGYVAGTQADKYFKGTDDFDSWATWQKVGYGAGGALLGVGILLVVLEATDTSLVKSDDELDPVAHLPKVTPFVSVDGRVGADVRF